jgi:hypothetical protein
MLSAELGSPTPGALRNAHALAAAADTGTIIRAGELQVWDLATLGDRGEWSLSGSSSARVVFVDRSGLPVLDQEFATADGTILTAPPTAARLVVQALGQLPEQTHVDAVPGAVALSAAAAGQHAVCGWQAGSLLAQVSPAVLLGRAATVRLPRVLYTRRDSQRTHQALVLAAHAVAGSPVCETMLPASVDIVCVIVDGLNDAPAAQPTVSAAGAELIATPTVIRDRRRSVLLYTVRNRVAGRPLLGVTVATEDLGQLAGVIGVRGDLEYWAAALTGSGARHLVPDGPVSAHGQLTLRYRRPSGGAAAS